MEKALLVWLLNNLRIWLLFCPFGQVDRQAPNEISRSRKSASETDIPTMLIRIPRLPPHLLSNPFCHRLPITQSIRCYANIDKSNPTRKTKFSALDDEMKALHLFIKNITPAHLPKDLCKVTFSRSSGPGGQNVNKYPPPQNSFNVD